MSDFLKILDFFLKNYKKTSDESKIEVSPDFYQPQIMMNELSPAQAKTETE